MKRNNIFLYRTGSLAVFFTCVNVVCSYSQDKHPNIILITADDLGFQLSCYGDKHINTANIDRLSSSGIRFENAFVTQGSSSPSRSSILTGLYPHQNGHIGLAGHGFSMKEGVSKLPNILKENGYRTGIIGKLHVISPDPFIFDYSYKNMQPFPTREVKNVASAAEEFMLQGDAPFFLYLNYMDPHTPLTPQIDGIPEDTFNVSDISPFPFQCVSEPKHLKRIADYYSCVQRLDYGIGELLKKMEKHNLTENTIIIFISDNGINFTRGKTTCYETGVKVPMFISWKNHIIPNSVCESLVSSVDILPTICDLLEITPPDNLPGRSIKGLLNNPKKKHREYVFSEFTYHGKGNAAYFPRRAITDGRYKLIYNVIGDKIKNPLKRIDGDSSYIFATEGKNEFCKFIYNNYINPGKYELYDLENDPFEFNNLINDLIYQDVVQELKSKLIDWMEQTNDPFKDEQYAMSIYEKQQNESKTKK